MSVRCSDTITLDLISNAGACVQALRASQESFSERERLVNLNLAFTAIHCLKYHFDSNVKLASTVCELKPYIIGSDLTAYSLRFQGANDECLTSPILRSTLRASQSADSEGFRIRWMTSQIEYRTLCLRIARAHESQSSNEAYIQTFESDLQVWKANLLS